MELRAHDRGDAITELALDLRQRRRPTAILDHVVPGMPAYGEELFGPVASILRATDDADGAEHHRGHDEILRAERNLLPEPRDGIGTNPRCSSRIVWTTTCCSSTRHRSG